MGMVVDVARKHRWRRRCRVPAIAVEDAKVLPLRLVGHRDTHGAVGSNVAERYDAGVDRREPQARPRSPLFIDGMTSLSLTRNPAAQVGQETLALAL